MSLTPKKEKFARLIAEGVNQSDAYKQTYKADAMKGATINNNAYKLMKDDDVLARVAQIKANLEEKSLWTREQSVMALSAIAMSGARPGEIVAAVKELNSMHGFNAPAKHELDVSFPRVINVIAGRA
jgi:hypothetical protein